MSNQHTIEQQKTFERLAGVITLQGWRDFDVLLASSHLMIERNGGRAACTVVMVPDEPTFQARFAFTGKPSDPILFTVGEGSPALRDATKDLAVWMTRHNGCSSSLETADQGFPGGRDWWAMARSSVAGCYNLRQCRTL